MSDMPVRIVQTLLLSALVASLVLAAGFGLQPPVEARIEGSIPGYLSTASLYSDVSWGSDDIDGPGIAYGRADRLLRRITVVLAVALSVVAGLGQLALAGVIAVAARAEHRLKRALGAQRRTIFGDLVRSSLDQLRDALILGAFVGASAWMVAAAIGQMNAAVPGVRAPSAMVVMVLVFALALAWTAASFVIVASGEALPGRPLQKACPLGEPFQGELCHPGVPVLQVAGVTLVLISTGILMRTVSLDASAGGLSVDPTMDRVAATLLDPSSLDLMASGQPQFAEGQPVAITSPGFWESTGHVAYATTECGRCIIPGNPPVLAPYKGGVAVHHSVNPDTFDLAGIVVVEGRAFSPQDLPEADPVAVVSRGFALEHFQDGRAVGRRVRIGDRNGTWHTVVGVIEPLPRQSLFASQLPSEDVLVPTAQVSLSEVELVGPGLSTLPLSPTQGISLSPPEPLAHRWSSSQAWLEGYRVRWILLGLGAFVFSVLGIAVTVARRVRELAPELSARRAVGATRAGLIGELFRFGLGIGAVGATLGAWIALFVLAELDPAAYSLSSPPAAEFLLPALTMIAVSAAAAMLSARGATRAIVP